MPPRIRLFITLFATAVGGAACSTTVGPTPDVVGGDATIDSSSSPICPSMLPANGSQCTREQLVCAYGDDPRVTCRPTATCTHGVWSTNATPCMSLQACPDLADGAADQACTTMGAECGYASMACTCTNCGPPYPIQHCAGDPTWHCATAPTTGDTNCPSPIANLGAACANEGVLCRYDCEGTLARRCAGGIWVADPQPNMCPVSLRSAKRDIDYLDHDDVDALAAQVLATPLATYEYRDPSNGAGRRLGFIIDDQPNPSFAVAADRGHVDLYGYTSLLVAAVQSQQREIEALRREVDTLRTASRRTAGVGQRGNARTTRLDEVARVR